jgi:hypothetical protein
METFDGLEMAMGILGIAVADGERSDMVGCEMAPVTRGSGCAPLFISSNMPFHSPDALTDVRYIGILGFTATAAATGGITEGAE